MAAVVPLHMAGIFPKDIVGSGDTSTVKEVELLQCVVVLVIVYVMLAVPTETPFTNPVPSTVATEELLVLQTPGSSLVLVNV